MAEKLVNWDKVDQPFAGLSTDETHVIRVRREAIPLVFVPGIMGSRLRLKGTDGKGDGPDGLPNLRWDAGDIDFMKDNFLTASPEFRKRMLIGPTFSSDYLEVDNADPVGDGFAGIMKDYHEKFLTPLKQQADWGPLGKVFEFPVYAFGYNWLDSNENSGAKLAGRIKEIIEEAKGVTGLCEKVILITHSMGGLVARWASECVKGKESVKDSILGVIHGVQPATGAPAAYWRIKGGFEVSPEGLAKDGFKTAYGTSFSLGASGRHVTPLLGNAPGGLQLLPTKLHKTNKGEKQWLTITEYGYKTLSLPKSDPYEEIYERPAFVRPTDGASPSKNCYWGLVDPLLLDPGNVNKGKPSKPNDVTDAKTPVYEAWKQYLNVLKVAEKFHDTLGEQQHPHTFCYHGTGYLTTGVVELRVESNWVHYDAYPWRGFRGFFRNEKGKSMQAVLQPPSSNGDGTVPVSSASALNKSGRPFPGDQGFVVQHQPSYEIPETLDYTRRAVVALCKMRYNKLRKK